MRLVICEFADVVRFGYEIIFLDIMDAEKLALS